MSAFLKIIRSPNLLIVAFTQYLLQHLVLLPALREGGRPPLLDGFHFFLLVLTTMLIAASGYVINDLLDYESDLVNKPEKVYVGRAISRKNTLVFYWEFVFVGFAIAWYLAIYVKNPWLLTIYPAAVLLLYYYSKKLKKLPLWGNVAVSVFCAFVAGVVLFAERENFALLEAGLREELQVLFGGYLVFAFLSTLLREIVKDLEDMEGDARSGLKTLPLRFGVATAKAWAIGTATMLLVCLVFFSAWLWENGNWLGLIFDCLGVALPLIYTLILLKKATSKPDFSKISRITKFIMLAGLILLIICKLA